MNNALGGGFLDYGYSLLQFCGGIFMRLSIDGGFKSPDNVFHSGFLCTVALTLIFALPCPLDS